MLKINSQKPLPPPDSAPTVSKGDGHPAYSGSVHLGREGSVLSALACLQVQKSWFKEPYSYVLLDFIQIYYFQASLFARCQPSAGSLTCIPRPCLPALESQIMHFQENGPDQALVSLYCNPHGMRPILWRVGITSAPVAGWRQCAFRTVQHSVPGRQSHLQLNPFKKLSFAWHLLPGDCALSITPVGSQTSQVSGSEILQWERGWSCGRLRRSITS